MQATIDPGQAISTIIIINSDTYDGANLVSFNPNLPSGLCHPYQLDESISNFRGVWCVFFSIFISFLIEISACKQCRP